MEKGTVGEQLEKIEISEKEARHLVEMGEALRRLSSNPDFQKVISKGYFVDEASRLVLLRAQPYYNANISMEENIKLIDQKIVGIGELRQYFLTINAMAEQARASLEDLSNAREEILENEVSTNKAN
jgi:hypothetical protein